MLLPTRLWPVCAVVCALAGCASGPPAAEDFTPAQVRPVEPPSRPVVRQGRYTLVELTPEADQRDLLSQVVETSIPVAVQPTVGDALEHVLLRSGYRLCPHSGEFAALLPLPLPAAHLHLGPMTLRDALSTLAGPTWHLAEDASRREVCFEQATPTVTPMAPTTAPATSLPVPPAEPLSVSTRHP